MNILFAASEAAPFCKTGGLADVVGSLPVALAKNTADNVAVILPLHSQIPDTWRRQMTFLRYIYIDVAWRHQYCGLFSLKHRGVTWYFVDNEQYFHRENLYGDYDDGERFSFFSRAVVSLLPSLEAMPDVIHCNDWQTALVPVYLRDMAVRWESVRRIKPVFTIHNIEYQGRFGESFLQEVAGLDEGWWNDGTLRMDGDINLLKGALLVSDRVNTVSPTYAMELRDSTYAHHMESVIASLGDKMTGILNGIDTESYDPATDPALARNYRAGATGGRTGGKALCKRALQREMGLHEEPDTPIISIVSRLVGHKGVDLVCQAFDGIMDTGAQVVILGKGEAGYEDFFRGKAAQYPGRVSAQITYAEDLSRRIYSGSDFLLMPSRSEPCGLSQMIAMRYGTVPIVRRTGGLADSVRSCQLAQPDGTGFLFDRYDAGDMLCVIRQATDLYQGDRKGYRTVQKNGMSADFSWERSAREYRKLYE